ncbi:MAG: D-tyrosyl-tRNA(Tyr) deacylase [Firmicutes bacterium]|nr:D-tyrosyl-tRNA(Tyr) deacylase [Bacillota bacterium]MBQ6622049.1 D-tyrosyl-tRNA(Tyr) deacylase [Mogibacterium sp.]
MKMVIQRVNHASVTIDGEVNGAIEKGFLVLLGVGQDDTEEIADKYVKKMVGLRIFDDEEGKTNLSLDQVGGSVLLISQFTLYANCKKGYRPSFIEAGDPAKAEQLYEYVIAKTKESVPNVQTGIFGAEMKVALENDGPFTIVLEGLEK